MKKLALVIGFLVSTSIASPALADTYVNGYNRSDGTYVQPHYRSDPNGNTSDNYSTRGNVNPYTGVAGTRNPYSNNSSPYSNSNSNQNSNQYYNQNSNQYSNPYSNPYSSPGDQNYSYPRY